jgi:polyphenol oxidase
MESLQRNDDGVYRVQGGPPGLVVGVAGRRANPAPRDAGPDEVRSAEKAFLSRITGAPARNILALDQLHGDTILVAAGPPSEDRLVYGEADGLLTAVPGICLVIRTADCVPVFAYDRERRVLGAVHSGWRGTRLAIAGKLVREMRRLYGSSASDLSVHILPSIGPESYTVGEDVASFFPGDVTSRGGALYLDLWRAVERALIAEGVAAKRIFNARISTRACNEEFFSHRGGDAGRNLNFAIMTGR